MKWLIVKLSCLSASGGFFVDDVEETKFCWEKISSWNQCHLRVFDNVDTIELLGVSDNSML
jgi:hypothetical protein